MSIFERLDKLQNVYATIDGAIRHDGVKATAFKRKTQRTFDALAWLQTGDMVPAGELTTTEITAEAA